MIIRLSFFISGCILGCKQYKHLIINIICGAGGTATGCMEKIIGTVPGKCRKKREKARLTLNNNPEISWHMKKSRRTYNGVHLNKKSNTQDVVEQSLTPSRKGS